MKVELSINVNYLPEWGVWEGIRELIQNGKDAETEFNAPLKVTHTNNTLRIENVGAALAHEALLLGTTSKADRSDTIGKFGEGLKLGILALVRGGHAVKIRSGSEVWIPSIADSTRFKARVLVFEIKDGNEPKKRVRVEIQGVSAPDWARIRECFLFLTQPKDNEAISTSRGQLLLGEKYKSKIFVKGIFVQHDPKLNYGYNFDDATVDRDRKMMASWELRWRTASIWKEAVSTRPDLMESFFALAEESKEDVASVDDVPMNVGQAAATRFQERFGKDAKPVTNLAESAEVEHLGAKGIVVSKTLSAVLASTLGTPDTIKLQLREEVVEVLSWSDLTDAARNNLSEAIAIMQDAGSGCGLETIDVVRFRSPKLQGQHKDGRILLAHQVLDDPDLTLLVLVHEYAHVVGADGEKAHVDKIETTWSGIVSHLRKGWKKR